MSKVRWSLVVIYKSNQFNLLISSLLLFGLLWEQHGKESLHVMKTELTWYHQSKLFLKDNISNSGVAVSEDLLHQSFHVVSLL